MTEIERQIVTDRDRQTETDRQTGMQTDRRADRQTDGQTGKRRDRVCLNLCWTMSVPVFLSHLPHALFSYSPDVLAVGCARCQLCQRCLLRAQHDAIFQVMLGRWRFDPEKKLYLSPCLSVCLSVSLSLSLSLF